MSRRWSASHAPAPVVDLALYRYGARTYHEHRPMPGCQERCCGGRADAWSDWMVERLEWQIGGFDLVPIIGALLGWVTAIVTIVRMLGGLLW